MSIIVFRCQEDDKERVKNAVLKILRDHYYNTVFPNTNVNYDNEGDEVYLSRLDELMNTGLCNVNDTEDGVAVEFDSTEDAGFSIANDVYHTGMGYSDQGLTFVDPIFEKIVAELPGIPFEADTDCSDRWVEEQSHYAYDGDTLLKNGLDFNLIQNVNELAEDGLSLKKIAEQLNVPLEDLMEAFPDYWDGSDEEESGWDDGTDEDSVAGKEAHFTDNLPRMTSDSEGIDALLEYGKQKTGSIQFNKELSFALVMVELQQLLVYMPINEASVQEAQKVGFPLNPKANGVLFLYESDGDWKTTTDKLLAICSVLNGSDNEWACPNPALLKALPTYYELCVALNIYLQDKNLYAEYISIDDEYTVLDFQVKDEGLIAKKMVC